MGFDDTRKLSHWLRLAFIFFILAGCLGITMRYAFVAELPEWIDYRNVMHAHSHIAMMGWLYCGLMALIVYFFHLDRKIYTVFFYGAIACSFGMLISFLVQGHGLISTFFTILHILLSYGFIVSVFKDLRKLKSTATRYSVLFLKTSLIFLFCSTLGTWMLGVIMTTALKGSALYYGSIQFFLHFQFNGWFVFSVIALLLQVLKRADVALDGRVVKRFYLLLTLSCALTYALAVTWSTPDKFIFWINSAGVIIQFLALLLFLRLILNLRPPIASQFSRWTYFLLAIAFASFSVKILIQTMVALPFIATMSYTVKNFVIGFIHLLMLGGMSTFIIALYNHIVPRNTVTFKTGIVVFLSGFILSEALLFIQGLMLWLRLGFLPGYYILILAFSVILLIGITLMGIADYAKTYKPKKH